MGGASGSPLIQEGASGSPPVSGGGEGTGGRLGAPLHRSVLQNRGRAPLCVSESFLILGMLGNVSPEAPEPPGRRELGRRVPDPGGRVPVEH